MHSRVISFLTPSAKTERRKLNHRKPQWIYPLCQFIHSSSSHSISETKRDKLVMKWYEIQTATFELCTSLWFDPISSNERFNDTETIENQSTNSFAFVIASIQEGSPAKPGRRYPKVQTAKVPSGWSHSQIYKLLCLIWYSVIRLCLRSLSFTTAIPAVMDTRDHRTQTFRFPAIQILLIPSNSRSTAAPRFSSEQNRIDWVDQDHKILIDSMTVRIAAFVNSMTNRPETFKLKMPNT
jgi:hypothetical protein